MLDFNGIAKSNIFIDFEDRMLSKTYCNAWVATAIIGQVAGAGVNAYTSNKAANAQKEAAETGAAAQIAASNKAADTALAMYGRTREDLKPFVDIGIDAKQYLHDKGEQLTGPIAFDPNGNVVYHAPGQYQVPDRYQAPDKYQAPDQIQPMTQAELEATPGYQFTRTQGLKAAQNSAALRGLGSSGAALKAATTFATGLADQTYKTQFDIRNQIYQNKFAASNAKFQNDTNFSNTKFINDTNFANTNYQNDSNFANTNFQNALTTEQNKYNAARQNQQSIFDRLKSLIDTGQNAAAQTGQTGSSASGKAADALIAGGNAAQAGAVGAANATATGYNALGSSVSKVADAASGYGLYKGIYGGGPTFDPSRSPYTPAASMPGINAFSLY